MKTASITITTGSRRGLFDLTRECANFVNGEGDGLLNVFVPHATAGVVSDAEFQRWQRLR